MRDGDTIVVRVPNSSREWAVRLKDTWCPELSEPMGKKAKEYAEKAINDSKFLALQLPLPEGVNPLKSLSFDRLVGYVFISPTMTLNELMVYTGHASTIKKGPLGE